MIYALLRVTKVIDQKLTQMAVSERRYRWPWGLTRNISLYNGLRIVEENIMIMVYEIGWMTSKRTQNHFRSP